MNPTLAPAALEMVLILPVEASLVSLAESLTVGVKIHIEQYNLGNH